MATTVQQIPHRSEIAPEHTWDTASIFPNDDAWAQEIAAIRQALPELARYQGTLSAGPIVLAAWLQTSESLVRRMQLVYAYGSMDHSVDATDEQAVAKKDRATSLAAQVLTAISFTEPELLAIGFNTLNRWLEEEPSLATYRHFLHDLQRRQAHVRSAEIEELLSQASEPFAAALDIHSILADADLSFQAARNAQGAEIPVAQGTIDALLADVDRAVRRTAWENYADAHLAMQHTMAACLTTGVKHTVFQTRARRYNSSLEAALSKDNIPVDVFHTLINTFRTHLPTWHRYWRIRRQALNLRTLHVYDSKAPLAPNQSPIPFSQAMQWITEGMQPLGNEYVETMRRGVLEQRWVDIFPNKGKQFGAFSTGMPGTHPFILMNYTNDIESVSTLAHELGHSMHSYYTWKTQPLVYSDYTIFAAEVASNLNQALVRAHLLATRPDRNFQIALIEEAMSNFHRYFFIMPTLARFELAMHERVERGDPLTSGIMNALLVELFAEGYGGEVEIDPDRVGITWAEFSTHLYANFYVFQYATGISGAHALAEQILNGSSGAVDRYLAFLRAGNSDYPLNLLTTAGVDLTTPEPVERTFAVLEKLVDRLEALVKQRPETAFC